MAMTVESENTQTTVIGTPHTLAAPTVNATRVLRLDLNALVAGEVVIVRAQTKVRSAGTIRNQYIMSYIGQVGNPVVETPPISGDLGATFVITQVNGTGRAIDWKVLTVATLGSESEGGQVCTINTPHTVASPTTNRTRILRLDLNPLVAGEVLRVEVRSKVRTAGTVRNQYDVSFLGPPPSPSEWMPIMETPPVSGDLGTTFVITQMSGTGRTFDWKVLTLD